MVEARKPGNAFSFQWSQGVSLIDRQEDGSTFRQVDQERLVAGRVTWGEDHLHRAITKQVIVIRCSSLQEMPAPAGSIEVFQDIAGAREPVGRKCVLVFRALNDMEGLRETPCCAGVIEMKVRK